MKRLDPLIEETFIATVSMTALGAFISLSYWALTGMSPWPYVVLSDVAASGIGIALLALAAPKRTRP